LLRVGAALRELLGARLARSGVLRDVLLRACRGAELRVGAADLLLRVDATLRDVLRVRVALVGALRVRVVDRLLRVAVVSLLEFVDATLFRVRRFVVVLRVVGALLVAQRPPLLSCVVVRVVRVADRLLVLPRNVSRRLRAPSNRVVSVFWRNCLLAAV